MTLKTITSEHRNLREISIHGRDLFNSVAFPTNAPQWMDLDRALIQLWESHAIRIRFTHCSGRGEDVCEVAGALLPEAMEREVVELHSEPPRPALTPFRCSGVHNDQKISLANLAFSCVIAVQHCATAGRGLDTKRSKLGVQCCDVLNPRDVGGDLGNPKVVERRGELRGNRCKASCSLSNYDRLIYGVSNL